MRLPLAVVMVGLAAPASAVELPRYDVSGHCSRVSAAAGIRSAEILDACEKREQEAHAALELDWPLISLPARSHCLHTAHMNSANYATLYDCVSLQRAAEERRRWDSQSTVRR